MNSLFDELRRKIESDSGQAGISAWELAQLPSPQRRIIRLILREVQMAYPQLRHAVANLPLEQRLEVAELDEALDRLLNQSWLIRMGQDQQISYRVNLRRKAGSRLAASLWEQLGRRIGGAPPPPRES